MLVACGITLVGLFCIDGCDEQQAINIDADAPTFEIVDVNNTMTWIDITEDDPNQHTIRIWTPPPPEWECVVHGVMDDEKNFFYTIDINSKEILRVCLRCYADMINKNVPALVKIDETETD